MSDTNGKDRREVLRLETDMPVVASLLFDDGLPVRGQYGDQVLYTISTEAGERVLYVDPHVSQMFEQLGIRRGEPFRIGKMTRREGNHRGIEWKVQRLEPEEMAPAFAKPGPHVESAGAAPPAPLDDPPPPTPPSPFDDTPTPTPTNPTGAAPPKPASGREAAPVASGAPERVPNLPQPTTPAPQPAPFTPPPPTPPTNPPAAAAHTGPRPHTPIPFAGRQDGQYILSALVNMIDMCSAAEHYAQAKSMNLHFSAEDVRALAITCFIQSARGGVR